MAETKVVKINSELNIYEFVEVQEPNNETRDAVNKTDTLMFLQQCKKYYNNHIWWWTLTFRPTPFYSFAKTQLIDYQKIRKEYARNTQEIRKRYTLKNKARHNYFKMYFARKKLKKKQNQIYYEKYFPIIKYFFDTNQWFSLVDKIQLERREYLNDNGRVVSQLRVLVGTLSRTEVKTILSEANYPRKIGRETLTILLYKSYLLYKKAKRRKKYQKIINFLFSFTKKI